MKEVRLLRNYCPLTTLSSSESGSVSFQIHGLVQLATRSWLRSAIELSNSYSMSSKALFTTAASLPWPIASADLYREHRKRSQDLLPHITRVCERGPQISEQVLLWASLIKKGSWIGEEAGDHGTAARLKRTAMEHVRSTHGPDHPSTLDLMSSLGVSLHQKGHAEEVEQLFRHVLRTRETILGHDHILVLRSATDLASCLISQERFSESLIMSERAWLGTPKPMESLLRMYRVGRIYGLALLSVGKHEEAANLLRSILNAWPDALHDKLSSLVNVKMDLAQALWRLDQLEEAEVLICDMLLSAQEIFGDRHPRVLDTRTQLADLLYRRGMYRDAERVLVPLIHHKKELYGPEHVALIRSWHLLAQVRARSGRTQSARKIVQRLVGIGKAPLGNRHHLTLHFQSLQVWLLLLEGEDEQAAATASVTVETCREALGDDHTETAVMCHLCLALNGAGQYQGAVEVAQAALPICEASFGKENPKTMDCLVALAIGSHILDRKEDAATYSQIMLERYRSSCSQAQGKSLRFLWLNARRHQTQDIYERGEGVFRDVLQHLEASDAAQSAIANTKDCLAQCLAATVEYDEAETLFKAVVAHRENTFRGDNRKTVQNISDLALCVSRLGR